MILDKRKIILVLLLGFIVNMAYPQQVVKRSAKKSPNWIGQVKEGYLITSATASTLEDAQRKCIDAVKIQMLESVAQNIEYSNEILVEQLTHNDEVQSNISFVQKGKNSVANLPYISGVSLSNATEAYWECIKDKATGELSYVYSMLYPYPHSEYMKMKSEFEALDNKMVDMLRKIKSEKDKINSIDSIEANISYLEAIEDYFFDKNRKKEAHLLTEQYKQILFNLNIESKRIEKCKFRCWITLNGEVMECSTLPKCKSETATHIRTSIDEESYVITFSDEECISDDDNHIDVTIKLKYNTLKQKLYF